MISIKNITKVYENKHGKKQVVLENTSFSFKKGVKTSILGYSGSGKTTLLNLIGGLDYDFSGELLFNGNTITNFDKYRRENVSFIFQDFNLINHYNLIDNIIIGITNDVKDKQKVALTLLEKVGLLEHAHKLPNQLSGGEMQRVAIARALARDTDVLLFDEPTGNLDYDTTEKIMKLIMEVSENKTVIFITHDKELAEKYSDEIIKVECKKIVVTRSCGKKLTEKYSNEVYKVESEIAVTRSDEKENDKNLSVSDKKKNKNFNKRFYKNLLAKKISLITSWILIILMSSIFLLGTGINKGIIDKINDYILDTYEVDKINLRVASSPIPIKTIKYVIDQENDKNGKNIKGFMASKGTKYMGEYKKSKDTVYTYLGDLRTNNSAYLLQGDIRKNIERYILYGRYPENPKEILISKGNAIRTLTRYKIYSESSGKEKQKYIDEIPNFSDEELLNEIKKLEISCKVDSSEEQSIFKVVGIIEDNYAKKSNEIFYLEDDFAYINGGQDEYAKIKFSEYSIFIKEENPKLRQKVFSSIIENNKQFFYGNDTVVSQYKKYHELYKNYRLGILSVCTLLALYGCIVIYNSIKTNILRSKKNIGIFKSLGYTSKNIRSMFFKEGIIISLTIVLMSLIVWSVMRIFVNDLVILLLPSVEKLEFSNITRLSFNSVIILFLVINLFVISAIIRIINVKNIIKILR